AHAVQLALASGSDVGELLQGDTLVRGDALRVARNIENVVAFPVASLADVIQCAEDASLFFAQHIDHFPARPDVELPLYPLTVCVERRIEAAIRRGQLPLHEAENLVGDVGEEGILLQLPGTHV